MRLFVKYQVIQHHSGQYPVSVMCQFLGISRSGYYDFLKRKDHADKDAPIKEANERIDRHSWFYNHKRIQLKTGVAPLTLRHSA